tara:strand:+ start:153 stop:407 length:255 start_codon:yes stop_codon:yes gene_type:complete
VWAYRTKEITLFLVLSLILCFPTLVVTSPMYGGDKPNVAKELPSREREVKLNHGIAECVRTAWIGDINNRTLICVEYRYKKEVK